MLILFILVVCGLGVLATFLAYSRRLWTSINDDFRIANQALKRVEHMSTEWHDCADKDERYRCLENARRGLRAAQRNNAARSEYKTVRAYLDDALWWLATLLIAHEPEYLQDLFGENRSMIKHLFWSWNGSMNWDGVRANQEQSVVRKLRLQLYREIQTLSKGNLVGDAVLTAAADCLKKRDYPGKTPNARLDAERNYIGGALRTLRQHRDEALANKAS